MPSILTRPSGGGGAGGSISIALSDSSPSLGDTITITATASGFTPTSYTLYVGNQYRGIAPITQAGATFTWTVTLVSTSLNIAISATDGSNFAYSDTSISSTIGVLTNCLLLVNDTSTFTPSTDGVKLTNQSDLSGNGNDATQGTVARQPLNDVTGINNLHSVQFGATSATYLESLFSIGASNSWTFVLDINTIAADSFFWIGASYNDGGTPYMGFGMTAGGNAELYERSAGYNTISNFTFSTSTTYLIQIRRTATYVEVWIDGVVIFARSTVDVGNRSTGIFFGSGFKGSFDGRIGHFEQVDRFITDNERIAQQDELFAKWNI
jgi:hypothetical protein